ncbi:MAG: POT family MFS transporter [Planctomycetota bacterium]
MPYRTAPDPQQTEMPGGIPYIVGNEAAERFSYYGMRAILYVFMTEYLVGVDGQPAPMDPTEATIWQHNFMKVSYAFPLLGAILCDWIWGKYRTILGLSLLYCVGHAVMAVCDVPELTGISPRWPLWIALALIALGSGGIKPCVSAHVGDQFGGGNKRLISKVFGWYYFSINLGAATSTVLTPWLLKQFGPAVAFGVPGVLMGLATLTFWLGRKEYVHVPPGGSGFFRETFSRRGVLAVANLLPLYALLAVFWSLFDQTTSTWVEQAKQMDRNVFGLVIDPSQIQAANPILIMLLIPVFTHLIYPWVERFTEFTPLRRIGVGLLMAPASFFIVAWVQGRIDAGESPHIVWQLIAYIVITAAEVLVSITALEFSYTQAPQKMKSLVTGVYWLSVYLGNEVVVKVNEYIQSRAAEGVEVLEGAAYFRFFAWAMAGTSVGYLVWSQFYRGQTYLQGEQLEPHTVE